MNRKMNLSKELKAAASTPHSPIMGKRPMTNVIRYVTGSAPDKKASLSCGKPSSKK